jgi:ribonuclease Z
MQALRLDIGYRLAHHGDKLNPEGIKLEITELPATPEPQAFLEIVGLTLESFGVDHFPVVPAFGYRARFRGRTVVLSGDTQRCDSLLSASRGADMLVCEALNLSMMEQRISFLKTAGMPREASLLGDIPTYHITTHEIAGLARDAGVGELVLTHIVPPITNDAAQVTAYVDGMSEFYPGPIHVARDTERVPVVRHGS